MVMSLWSYFWAHPALAVLGQNIWGPAPLPYFFLPIALPLKYSHGVWGSAVSSPSGVWGAARAEIECYAF